jgi:hypothetical protein
MEQRLPPRPPLFSFWLRHSTPEPERQQDEPLTSRMWSGPVHTTDARTGSRICAQYGHAAPSARAPPACPFLKIADTASVSHVDGVAMECGRLDAMIQPDEDSMLGEKSANPPSSIRVVKVRQTTKQMEYP